MKHARYQGLVTPMVTPLTEQGDIDRATTVRLMEFLHRFDANPFVLGTTGEGSSIAIDQREVLVKLLVQESPPHLPTMAGVPGLPFADTVRVANRYLELGLEAVVLTLPNYLLLSAPQMLHYFEELAGQIKGNLILYNIPKTIHMSIPLEVVETLSHRENVIGIKDSEPGEARLGQALARWKDRNNFFHFVGTNALMSQGLQGGSRGIVPSTANLFPQLYQSMIECCKAGKVAEAREVQQQTNDLSGVYQQGKLLGESLAMLKRLLAIQGLSSPHMAPPLLSESAEAAAQAWEQMRQMLPEALTDRETFSVAP
ncbi:MAG: dihydrodipicolinate synthase family protein [Tunicatimonas sp.]